MREPVESTSKPRTLGPWSIAGIVAAIIGACFIAGRHAPENARAEKSEPAPVVTVAIMHVEPGPIRQILPVTGSVYARDPLSIGAEASGLRIDHVYVEEGSTVKRGQVLATLDASVLKAQLRQAQARLRESRASVSKAIQPNRPLDIMWLESGQMQARHNAQQEAANLREAQATFDNADTNNRRYHNLYKQGAVSIKDVEDHQTALDQARAALDAARERLRATRFATEQADEKLSLANAGGRPEDVEIARANADEMSANIEQLQALIAQTVVRAPDDGIITQRSAHIGDITSTGKALFSMIRGNRLELRAQVPETELYRLSVGQTVRVHTTSGRVVSGRVWLITPQVDPQTRLGIARILIPASARLLSGMFVRADIDGGTLQALSVPSACVLGNGQEHHVFVLDGDRVRRRTVTLGMLVDNNVEVSRGLRTGDVVVTRGAGFLTDGDVVRVVDAEVPAGTTGARPSTSNASHEDASTTQRPPSS